MNEPINPRHAEGLQEESLQLVQDRRGSNRLESDRVGLRDRPFGWLANLSIDVSIDWSDLYTYSRPTCQWLPISTVMAKKTIDEKKQKNCRKRSKTSLKSKERKGGYKREPTHYKY